jgi:Xaa-Pro dipeptidase
VNTRAHKSDFVNHEALRAGMELARLDVVVATSPWNAYYLSGCYLVTHFSCRDGRLAVAVVPREGPETYIVCNLEETQVRYIGPYIEDVRSYVEFAKSPIQALAEVLAEKGLTSARVGIEMGYCSVAHYQEMQERLPRATLVPADAIFDRARAIKTQAEIDRLRKTTIVAEEAAYSAWQRSHPGDTEKVVAERMAEEMAKRGAERPNHLMFSAGKNTTVSHHVPGSKKLELGDLVACDFGAFVDGYWSDLGRMGVVGRPSQRQRDQYKTLREVQRATIARLKPGALGSEVFKFAKAEYEKRGVDFSWQPHIGHSMPQTDGHERPMIQPFDKMPLEHNMLIALEPYFVVGDERYHMEDLVLITESGPRIISDRRTTEELFVFE